MEFILDFIFSILGELLLERLNRLPKFIARLLLLVPLLFFGGTHRLLWLCNIKKFIYR